MKKILTLMLIVLTIDSSFANKKFHADEKKPALVNYTWYYDADFSEAVGSTSEVNTELNRLRNLFPSYTFSSSPSPGMYAYEYGYYPFYVVPVIYSNIQ
jgi:hypothetical protein